MTKKNVKPVPFKYFHEKMKEEQDLLNLSMEESFRQRDERKMKEPYTIIHTEQFYCDGSEEDYDKHPRVHYTFNNKVDSTDKTDKGYVVCEYCYKKFKYEEKKSNTDFINDVLRGGQ